MELDAGPMELDAGPMEVDAGPMEVDAGPMEVDAGPMEVDAGVDAGPMDAGVDAGLMEVDAGPIDAGVDGGGVDGGGVDGGCGSAADCSNGNACDGAERCVAGACLPPTAPLACNDGRACTADSCVPATGCVFGPIDADMDDDPACTDCNDASSAFRHGATEVCNALDDDCDLSTDEGVSPALYSDCDGDGFAPYTATFASTCMAPPVADTGCESLADAAWTPRVPEEGNYDCADAEPAAHSTVTSFFTGPIPGVTDIDPSIDFDYDCDLVEELQFPDVGSCARIGARCVPTPGWSVAVPDCGEAGTFITSCNASCVAVSVSRVQACR
jgi:hypothetical protein